MPETPNAPSAALLEATCRREHAHCFACRAPEEGGLGLHFRVEPDGVVEALWNSPVGTESYPGIVHGGLVATLLDAAMAHALFARGIAGRTGDLRIRYRSPVRIGSTVRVRVWLTDAFGPLYGMQAEVLEGARVCAAATARFMRARPTEAAVRPRPEAGTDWVRFRPIGVIRSEHRSAEATPVQPVYAHGCSGTVELYPEFADGLDDITGFSHVYLIYHLHRAGPARLRVKPFLGDAEHGVFATRAPDRPNPIGISLVRLLRRDANVLSVADVDVLDGTPLLDLKPYSPRFDAIVNPIGGWTDCLDDETARHRGLRGYK